GNHGEDVKECYYYLDSTPTHSYMKMLYKYPQSEYPYSLLVEENRKRGLSDPEYELEDTGVFDENRYWDVTAEYAKNTPNDVLCRYTVANRGPEEATLHVIPVLWYRNTWIWGCKHEGCTKKPSMKQHKAGELHCSHETLGQTTFIADKDPSGKLPAFLFTENETNYSRLYNVDNYTPYTKDAFHRYIVNGEKDAINHKSRGTKVGMHYMATVKPGEQQTFQVRFFLQSEKPNTNSYFSSESFDKVFAQRMKEADEFYEKAIPNKCPQQRAVARQAYAGLLWSKQFYHYIIKDWLSGDPEMPAPPRERFEGRNKEWGHLFNRDVISMPDKWEYPWYASWDLAFHMLPFAAIDIDFAKDQLLLFLREWYMHPNGQIPAYEFAFGDVNPPVHAWAVRKVYKATGPRGSRDHRFLARCFQKLILNFTW
ncbi:uncharacterized protein YMR196W-like, partial [Lingula anatina]|uniref:Uncharacterized protein YMR196W-like n=1 Tax=Lingula anatina TaxID=7574 RepID=A0A1S3JE16_LINAN